MIPTRTLAKTAGVKDPAVRWRMVEGPHFDNQVATLELHNRKARITLERTKPGDMDSLEVCFSRELA